MGCCLGIRSITGGAYGIQQRPEPGAVHRDRAGAVADCGVADDQLFATESNGTAGAGDQEREFEAVPQLRRGDIESGHSL